MAQQCYGLATRYAVRHDNKDRAQSVYRIVQSAKNWMRSSFFKRQSLSNSIEKRLICVCYNISRSLTHEPKQAHFACNWFTFFLAYITHCVPRSQLLRQLFPLYISLTVYRRYRVPSYLDNFLSCKYHSLRTGYRVASHLDNFLSCIYHSLHTA